MIYCSFFSKNEKRKGFQHNAAHSLLGLGLLKEYSLDYEKEELGFKEHGKPFLLNHPEIEFNLSHCCGCSVCIIDKVPVGIDVERVRDYNERTAKRVCTKNELEYIANSKSPNRAFFKLWTLKESAVKTTGTGITVPLTSFEFSISYDNSVVSNHPELSFTIREYDEFIISFCKLNLT